MFFQWPDFPMIRKEHLWDARLYATREDMIRELPVPRHGKIAEIGVWRAAFSKFLVTELKPREFFAFDIFTGHLETDWNGMTGAELFEGLTHRQFYEREMSSFRDIVTVVEGASPGTTRNYADHSFDLVYVDAAHDYASVKADTEVAEQMVADSGFLVFNDYVLLCTVHRVPYGVVPVVNDIVANHGWRIVGFSLNVGMYCDIALRRPSQSLASKVAEPSNEKTAKSANRFRDVTIRAAKLFSAMPRRYGTLPNKLIRGDLSRAVTVDFIKRRTLRLIERAGYSVVHKDRLETERHGAHVDRLALAAAVAERDRFSWEIEQLGAQPIVPSEIAVARQSYAKNGFFIFRNVLSRDAIQNIHDVLERDILPSDRAFLRHRSNEYERHSYTTVGDGSNRRIVCNALVNPHCMPETHTLARAIEALLCTNAVADLLTSLDREERYSIHQTILFFIPPGADLHIDGWSLDTKPRGRAHTVWVPLETVTLSNGALAVVPWPRGKFLSPTDLGLTDFLTSEDPSRQSYKRYHAALLKHIRDSHIPCVVPQLDPGDMVVFTSLTPHGTLPFRGGTPSRRSMQVLVRPTKLPWAGLLGSLEGHYRTSEDLGSKLIPVNERWHSLGP